MKNRREAEPCEETNYSKNDCRIKKQFNLGRVTAAGNWKMPSKM